MTEREVPIEITNEKLKALKIEDMEYEWGDDSQFQNLHYSKKSAHAARSRQTPRKRSRRR